VEPAAGGAASQAWRVRDLPATYVLDANGVLRGIDLHDAELNALIRELLGELRHHTAAREAFHQNSGNGKHR
jgi:hypothetical protein